MVFLFFSHFQPVLRIHASYFVSVSLSLFLSLSFSLFLSLSLSFSLLICSSLLVSFCLSFCLPSFVSFYLSICNFNFVSLRFFVFLSFLSVRLFNGLMYVCVYFNLLLFFVESYLFNRFIKFENFGERRNYIGRYVKYGRCPFL